ncbi:small basic family protein [Candidatus Oleimmundimicrobium sp.]|uniref:small basic family protein n=1 Tax=Candidatus Oleimmundimicrobium sp. TaxID=3060597 RepID=UPI0027292E3A|nr:small basic family protein [Candidatus Oleimmundimicrobium sp.]MDO8885315.1 small basic family protein [Candidatus Oleimmundimicrobium sp.]
MLPLIGLLIGVALGLILKIPVPPSYAKYLGVATLAALDSAFGGIRASLEKEFNDKLFISGFFSNTILAAFIVYMGDRLGVEPLYYAAIVAFGVRLFQNIAVIRRIIFERKYWGQE